MQYTEAGPIAVIVVGRFWSSDAVSEEYGISPFLGPELRSVRRGRRNGESRPRLPSAEYAADFRQ